MLECGKLLTGTKGESGGAQLKLTTRNLHFPLKSAKRATCPIYGAKFLNFHLLDRSVELFTLVQRHALSSEPLRLYLPKIVSMVLMH